MKLNNRRQEVTRFLRFAVVGAIGAVVDFAIFNLLTTLAGMQANIGQAISFTCAVVSNFIWNRFWTYPDSRSKPLSQQMVQFVVVSVIGLSIRTPLFTYMEKVLTDFFRTVIPVRVVSPVFLAHNVSLAIAILVVMLWNFIANRLWTYNDIDRPTQVV